MTASLSVYFIVFTIVGGLLALFGVAGWSSYNTKKLPELGLLFRSFLAGIFTAGLGAYAWLFGFNGDPTKLMEQVSDALEVKETLETLSQATASIGSIDSTGLATESREAGCDDMKVGMPNF